MNRIKLKTLAKEQISGNIAVLFLISLAIYVIVFAASTVTEKIYGIGGFIIAPALSMSSVMVYLNLSKGIKPQFTDAFNGFEFFGKSLVLYIITQVFVFLWSLLLIIPGIVKSISYSMAAYILADNPHISATDALNESKRIMQGRKMDYFVLSLSFIPWMLFGTITFGIGMIYVIPYMNMTLTNFYNDIKPADYNTYDQSYNHEI